MKSTAKAISMSKTQATVIKPSFLEHKSVKITAIALAFVILIFSLLLIYQKIYASKIYPNVRIGSINLSGKTKTEALNALKAQTSNLQKAQFSLKLGNNEQKASLELLGMNINYEKTVNDAYNYGKTDNFWQGLLMAGESLFKKEKINLAYNIDDQKLQKSLESITANLPKAQDSTVVFENGQFNITTSNTGLTVDINQFKNDLLVNSQNNNFTITLIPQKTFPKITENQVGDAKTQAEKYASAPIALSFEDQNYQFSRQDIASWIKYEDKNGQLVASLDNGKILQSIGNIAKKTDIDVQDKEILEGSNAVLKEGKAGRELNKTATLNSVLAILNSGKDRNIALLVEDKQPVDKYIKPDQPAAPAGGMFPGKYIDVDLSNQVLTLFVGTQAIGSYRVSTGKWSMPTPVGTRSIEDKNPRAYSSKYNLYMPFWNSIGGGYGIHELPEWSNGAKEGESHLGTPVSHGCIRLGVGPAETVYNWADTGTPVYIHK